MESRVLGCDYADSTEYYTVKRLRFRERVYGVTRTIAIYEPLVVNYLLQVRSACHVSITVSNFQKVTKLTTSC